MSKEEHRESQSKTAEILQRRGYRLISQIGEGSYAKVYLSEFSLPLTENETQPTVIKLACKVEDTKRNPKEFVKKFLPRELSILKEINHPHVIHIHSILQIGMRYYIFMRHAEKHDLLDFIVKNGVVNENQARVWTRQMALALQYLHAMNVAHRDIKCENILITQNYNVKLTDFGFARYTVDAKQKPVLSETYCGSLSYAAPEILVGRPYNPKLSDNWSFGVVIYVMLNKSMPFNEPTAKALHDSQVRKKYKFRAKIASLLSHQVKYLINNLLEPDPQRRFPIESVISSDWIAMDKRLTTLGPLEIAALARAVNRRTAQSDSGNVKKTVKSVKIDDKLDKDDAIKVFKNTEEPRESLNSKYPHELPDEIVTLPPAIAVDKEETDVGSQFP